MGKYKAGDMVTIKLDEMDVENINNAGDELFRVYTKQIIKHEPAPFDWADVKPGMAFEFPHSSNDNVYYYIGLDIFGLNRHVFHVGEQSWNYESFGTSIDHLVRVPEHDIEVK